MLTCFSCNSEALKATEGPDTGTVWFDLLNPTDEERSAVERALGIVIPSREEMEEIELSARLYQEGDTRFMTMTALSGLDTDAPERSPVTFVLKDRHLVTIRFAEPKPFKAFINRAQREKTVACATGEQVMLGLLEAMSDRIADALEKASGDVDMLSREIFTDAKQKTNKKTRDLKSVIIQIGRRSEVLTIIQESLVSIGRLVAYHGALEPAQRPEGKAARHYIKLIQRDAGSLGEYAESLNTRLTFLLDATLGMINLEQNGIIKIFSVAAVVFLPPTLVASIYGMNFEVMPELDWFFGYPFALGLMVVFAILPFFFFKRKGWL